ncbi:hypothetical protein LTR15_010026 [Elasticomyces elasticus]|nr:hypothetical protein LTR15_010026 [Elasticomyces elasticus]
MAPIPPRTPSGGSTKCSSSSVPLVGGHRMRSLYKRQLVSVYIGSDRNEYQVPWGLIRASSEYFDRAFGDKFIEGVSGKTELATVKPWVFECFVGWLYTQKIFWEQSEELELQDQPNVDRDMVEDKTTELLNATEPHMVKPEIVGNLPFLHAQGRSIYWERLTTMWLTYHSNPPGSPARARAEVGILEARSDIVADYIRACSSGYAIRQASEFTDADLIDPVTWNWQSLFELYVFADMFETRRLRTAVMEFIQKKTFLSMTREYLLPDTAACGMVFRNLPETAGLYKWLVDVTVYTNALSTPESFQLLPPQALGMLLNKSLQLANCSSCPDCEHGHRCEDPSHPDIKTAMVPYMQNLCL